MDGIELLPRDLQPAVCRLHIVCGSPGSGKSTFVQRNKSPGDEVIDLDEIISELSGQAMFQADKAAWMAPALESRNKRLRLLSSGDPARVVWFIVSAAGIEHREWWTRELRPVQLHLMRTPFHECEARIRSDQRRAPFVQAHLAALAEYIHRETCSARAAMQAARWAMARGDRDD